MRISHHMGGRDVDKANNDGTTPLFVAALEGHGEVVEALIKAGADVDKVNKSGNTPLYVAARKVRGRVVDMLLKGGCDPSRVKSIPALMVGPFVEHLTEQQMKMMALAGGLHRRLGAESVVFRLDDNLLQMVWEQVVRRCGVPPVLGVEEEAEEVEEEEEEEEKEEENDDDEDGEEEVDD